MQSPSGKWLAGLAFALSAITLGNSMYTNDNAKVDRWMLKMEEIHKADVSELRKKHDGDIDAVRTIMVNMGTGLHSKLDDILDRTMSIHVGVEVNTHRLDTLEKTKE